MRRVYNTNLQLNREIYIEKHSSLTKYIIFSAFLLKSILQCLYFRNVVGRSHAAAYLQVDTGISLQFRSAQDFSVGKFELKKQ